MIAEIYDALRDAGVEDVKARRAAEAMATASSNTAFETQVGRDFAQVHRDFASVRSDIRLLQWHLGLLFAITVPTLLLVLRLSVKLGALQF